MLGPTWPLVSPVHSSPALHLDMGFLQRTQHTCPEIAWWYMYLCSPPYLNLNSNGYQKQADDCPLACLSVYTDE